MIRNKVNVDRKNFTNGFSLVIYRGTLISVADNINFRMSQYCIQGGVRDGATIYLIFIACGSSRATLLWDRGNNTFTCALYILLGRYGSLPYIVSRQWDYIRNLSGVGAFHKSWVIHVLLEIITFSLRLMKDYLCRKQRMIAVSIINSGQFCKRFTWL